RIEEWKIIRIGACRRKQGTDGQERRKRRGAASPGGSLAMKAPDHSWHGRQHHNQEDEWNTEVPDADIEARQHAGGGEHGERNPKYSPTLAKDQRIATG